MVRCNDPRCFSSFVDGSNNKVGGTASFVPKSLVEQFRCIANCFFLVIAYAPLVRSRPSVLPPSCSRSSIVVRVAMAKGGVKDQWRKQ
uniref:P-type ATPase N-terminal domain-containing protein n=1 Tax=Oryza brachyantha TaxID=4533 RepID=J3MX87_ORYBR